MKIHNMFLKTKTFFRNLIFIFRRVTIISMKVLMEFVNNENESTEHYMELIFSCLNNRDQQQQNNRDQQQSSSASSHYQWWLGRLIYIKRLFDEHPALLFSTNRHFSSNFSLAVSPNAEINLTEFLNSL